MPDAIPQRLHCDTGSPSPALFTTFVALQDVTESMGPTRFLLSTNRQASHRQFSADKTSFLNKAVSRIALLQEGDAVVYDSRVLHCGTENHSDKPRVLLVLTVRHVEDVSVDPAAQRTRRAYSKTKVLSELLEKRRSCALQRAESTCCRLAVLLLMSAAQVESSSRILESIPYLACRAAAVSTCRTWGEPLVATMRDALSIAEQRCLDIPCRSKAGPIIPVVRQMDMMPVKQNLSYPKAASQACAAGPTQPSQTAIGSPVASVETSRGSDRQAQQASVCSPVHRMLLDGSRRGSPTRVEEACVNSTQGSPVLLGTSKLSKHPEASSRGTPVRIVGGPPMQVACCKTELAETARAAARAAASPISQPAGSGISDPQSETRTPSGSLQSLPVVSGSCKLIGQSAPCPDPFLSTGPSAAPLSPMARTPELPGDGRNGSWSALDSRQSLTSSFLGNDNSSPPHFGSAKILHTSSNKHRTLSPGAACVVLPPSPEIAPRGVGPVSSDVQGIAGESHIQATLFELFRVPVSEPHVAEQVGKEIARQVETLWDDLVILRPVRSLASAVARSISSSGQAKDEQLWTEHLGDEEAYQGWWICLLARYGLSGSGDSISRAEVTDLAVAACRMLRDHFAPSKYLRNLRTVRSGAKRVHDRFCVKVQKYMLCVLQPLLDATDLVASVAAQVMTIFDTSPARPLQNTIAAGVVAEHFH